MNPASRKKLVRTTILVVGFLALCVGLALIVYNWMLSQTLNDLSKAAEGHRKNAPFMTSPDDVVDMMLELSDLDSDDVVYDLGCGDGRILIAAALKYRCRGVGYEYDPEIAKLARERVEKAGLADLVTIHQGDIFEIPRDELNKATVVTLYLLEWMNNKLIPQLLELDEGKVIVSHDWGLEGYKPERTEQVIPKDDPEKLKHLVHMWKTPLKPISNSQ